jgi:hypothetical protein
MKAIGTCFFSFVLLIFSARAGIQIRSQNGYANRQLYNSVIVLDTISPKHGPVAPADLKLKMLGIWRDAEGENATFEVKPTNIYYFDHAKAYSYKLAGNVLTIKFPDYNFTGKVSFMNETMIIDSKEFGVSRYKKMK